MLNLLLYKVTQQRLLRYVLVASGALVLWLLSHLALADSLEQVLVIILHAPEDALKFAHE